MTRTVFLLWAIVFLPISIMCGEAPSAEAEARESDASQVEPERNPAVEQRAEMQRMLERRIEGEFAFEVINQDGVPVPGVSIIFEVKNIKKTAVAAMLAGASFSGSWLDEERTILKTDAHGIAQTKRVSANHDISARIDGESLDPTLTISENQNSWSENPDNPGFIAKSQPHTSRPGITYIFRVIRHANPEPLRRFEIHQSHPGDGAIWYVAVFGNRWANEEHVDGSWRADFAVTAFRDPEAPLCLKGADGSFSGPTTWQGDWRFEIAAINGGLVADRDPLVQSAPEDGYEHSYAWSCKADQPGFTYINQQSWWWRRSGTPDKYSRIGIELLVNPYTGMVDCRFRGFINPTGSKVIILPTRETPPKINWVKSMTEDVDKMLRNDPLGQAPVIPPKSPQGP